jgi:ComF family protein
MRFTVNSIKDIAAPFLDLIYPPICFLCDGKLETAEEKICGTCWESFHSIDSAHSVWRELDGKFSVEGVVSEFQSCYLFESEGTFQHAIHLLKYEGVKSLGVRLGREIGERILQSPRMCKADMVLPVPLHRSKERERGYNQSSYICRGISDVTNIPAQENVLTRTRFTQSQTKLNLEERKKNVEDAFSVSKNVEVLIQGKSIILIDDVITTGATINACARVLREGGAENVFAASAALAE